MPKRPTRNIEIESGAPAAERKSLSKAPKLPTPGAWERARAIALNRNVRWIASILMLTIAFCALVAYISYFFTGQYDISLLQEGLSNRELKESIRNSLGPVGARLGHFLVDQTFGISSIALIWMLVAYSTCLVKPGLLNPWRQLFCPLFWLIWGSIAAGYMQLLFHLPIFFRLGGAHGEWVARRMLTDIRWIGSLAILLAVLAIFLVLAHPKTVEFLKQKVADRLQKKGGEENPEELEKPENPESTDTPEEPAEPEISGQETEIELTDLIGNDTDTPATDTTNEVELVIEGAEDHADDNVNVNDNIDANEDADVNTDKEQEVEIEKPVENELLENDPDYILKTQGPYDPRAELSHYRFPSLDLLKVYDNENAPIIDPEEQKANAARIVTTLKNYGVEIESIKATVGPTVTLYEVVPKAGIRISKIQSLEADIMLSLSAVGIRIIAPIPGKGTVGIEVPNANPQTVSMHSVIASKKFQENTKMKLPIALGRTITNDIFLFDLAKTPHLLVAGATGQGKSVAINAIITSLLYKKHPSELKMVLVDPKKVEFSPYRALFRHYLASQPEVEERDVIITDCMKVVDTLNSLVIEMENRYELLEDAGVRNLEEYNEKFINRRLNPTKVVADKLHHQFLPYIVIIIDEYGDFIMQAGKQVETPIARITQKARAVGMHMILATQRPSVNIVTGVIKANIPTRIALRTQSVVDSRTVLDAKGADQLIGRGDLLYSGGGELTRIQCAFVDTPEVMEIVKSIQGEQSYFGPYELPEYVGDQDGGGGGEALAPGAVDLKKLDPMFRDIATFVVRNQQGSTSVIQRHFQIGYNRAGKLSDQLEAAGIVGPNKGPKGRDVLIQDESLLQQKLEELNCL